MTTSARCSAIVMFVLQFTWCSSRVCTVSAIPQSLGGVGGVACSWCCSLYECRDTALPYTFMSWRFEQVLWLVPRETAHQVNNMVETPFVRVPAHCFAMHIHVLAPKRVLAGTETYS